MRVNVLGFSGKVEMAGEGEIREVGYKRYSVDTKGLNKGIFVTSKQSKIWVWRRESLPALSLSLVSAVRP